VNHCNINASSDAEFCGESFLSVILRIFTPDATDQNSSTELINAKDERISKAVALAPIGVHFYGESMLSHIDIPVLLIGAEYDHVLLQKYQAEYWAKNIKNAVY
jgi:predicted dienelactone hydrolase